MSLRAIDFTDLTCITVTLMPTVSSILLLTVSETKGGGSSRSKLTTTKLDSCTRGCTGSGQTASCRLTSIARDDHNDDRSNLSLTACEGGLRPNPDFELVSVSYIIYHPLQYPNTNVPRNVRKGSAAPPKTRVDLQESAEIIGLPLS